MIMEWGYDRYPAGVVEEDRHGVRVEIVVEPEAEEGR